MNSETSGEKCQTGKFIFTYLGRTLLAFGVLCYIPAAFQVHGYKGFSPMATPSPLEITLLLTAWSEGDQAALEQLVPLVHSELHRIAQRHLKRGNPGQLLQTSALINEAWLRLIDWQNAGWQNRAHFFGVAAQLMRRVLVDEFRGQHSQKRGGDALRVSLVDAEAKSDERSTDLVALDDALKSLAQLDERKSRIIELRYFGGLSVEETAEVLHVSTRTIKREWSLAQAWLFRELSGKGANGR